jgi:hypothetical protein
VPADRAASLSRAASSRRAGNVEEVPVKRLARFAPSVCLVLGGFVGGVWFSAPFATVSAQPTTPEATGAEPVDISEANAEKIKQATDAVATAEVALEQDGLYKRAIRGMNAYAVFAGGLDAVADLESGRGVDPITYAGLYAGLATDEVIVHLANDATGRLTYKGKLVRMYPPELMKRLNNRQASILAVAAGGKRVGVEPAGGGAAAGQ